MDAAVMFKGTRGITIALTIMLLISGPSAVASTPEADEVWLSQSEQIEMRKFWTSYGVSAETQNALMEKFLTTGTFDALLSGSSGEVESTVVEGSSVSIERFEDGSIRVVTVELPETENPKTRKTTGSINGCKNSSGSGYAISKGCKVQTSDSARTVLFYADWASYNGANAEILRTYNPTAAAIGGTMTPPTLTYWRPASTSKQDARATYSSVFTGKNNASSETINTTLWLTRSGLASVSSS